MNSNYHLFRKTESSETSDAISRKTTFEVKNFQANAKSSLLPINQEIEELNPQEESMPVSYYVRDSIIPQQYSTATRHYQANKQDQTTLEEYKPGDNQPGFKMLVQTESEGKLSQSVYARNSEEEFKSSNETSSNIDNRSNHQTLAAGSSKEKSIAELISRIKPNTTAGNLRVDEIIKEILVVENLPIIQNIITCDAEEKRLSDFKPFKAKIVQWVATNGAPIMAQNSKFQTIVSFENCGEQTWPTTTIFYCVNGIFKDTFRISAIDPGDSKGMKLDFTVPPKPGRCNSVWRLACKAHKDRKLEEFGPHFELIFDINYK